MMIAAMMIAAISANAQNEVGQLTLMPKAGINISSITGDGEGKKAKVGLVAGVEAEYGITENFGIDFGVLYSMEGCKSDLVIATGTGASAYLAKGVKWNMDYINIPILAQYYPINGLAIKAGVQFGFIVRQKAKIDVDGIQFRDGTIDEFFNWFNEHRTAAFPEGKLNKFDFSIPVGLSYEYQSFVLDARYNIGVTKLVKDADQGRNSTFSITIGYKFAL